MFSLKNLIRLPLSRFTENQVEENKYQMNFINCDGNETTIEDCNHRKFDWISGYVPASVICLDNGEFIRLTNHDSLLFYLSQTCREHY